MHASALLRITLTLACFAMLSIGCTSDNEPEPAPLLSIVNSSAGSLAAAQINNSGQPLTLTFQATAPSGIKSIEVREKGITTGPPLYTRTGNFLSLIYHEDQVTFVASNRKPGSSTSLVITLVDQENRREEVEYTITFVGVEEYQNMLLAGTGTTPSDVPPGFFAGFLFDAGLGRVIPEPGPTVDSLHFGFDFLNSDPYLVSPHRMALPGLAAPGVPRVAFARVSADFSQIGGVELAALPAPNASRDTVALQVANTYLYELSNGDRGLVYVRDINPSNAAARKGVMRCDVKVLLKGRPD